jgi:drug/metabolite transporter (DMT)-like permease
MRLAPALAFVLVSFALNSLVTRLVVSRGLLDAGLVTWARFAAGAVALVALAAARRGTRWTLAGAAWPATWLGAYAVLISYGYAFITAAAGTFVFYACNLATLVLGAGRRHEPRAIAGGALALAGVALLALGKVAGSTPLGVAMLAATGVAWGLYTLRARRAADPLAFTTAAFVALALTLLLPAAAWVAVARPVMTAAGWLLVAAMGAFTTAVAYVVWSWTAARIGAAQAGTYQLLIPVLTAAAGVTALGEPFSWRLVAAGALVVAGMALAKPRPA